MCETGLLACQKSSFMGRSVCLPCVRGGGERRRAGGVVAVKATEFPLVFGEFETSCRTIPQSRLRRDSSLCTREPWVRSASKASFLLQQPLRLAFARQFPLEQKRSGLSLPLRAAQRRRGNPHFKIFRFSVKTRTNRNSFQKRIAAASSKPRNDSIL